MSRVGKIISLSILFVSLLTPSAHSGEMVDCLKHLLEKSFDRSFEMHPISYHLKEYNLRLARDLNETAVDLVPFEFDRALTKLQQITPSFPKDDFLDWYRRNPITQEELISLQKESKTVGDLLHEQVARFEVVSRNTEALGKVMNELSEHLKSLKKVCGQNEACYRKGITRFLPGKLKNMCLFRDPSSMKSMINGFSVYAAGMAITHGKDKAKDFPYELLINNTLWIPIMGEIDCLNKEKGQLLHGPLKKRTFTQHVTHNYLQYMKTSPLNEASYMAMHLAAEKWRGHQIETDPKHLAATLVGYIGWDVAIAVPRSVLFTAPFFTADPMFQKVYRGGMPAIAQTLKSSLPNGVGGATALGMDYGVRTGLSALSTWGFGKYGAMVESVQKKIFHEEDPSTKAAAESKKN